MKKIIGILIMFFFLLSCKDVLEKNNLGVFGGEFVWTSESMTAAYLSDIYSSPDAGMAG